MSQGEKRHVQVGSVGRSEGLTCSLQSGRRCAGSPSSTSGSSRQAACGSHLVLMLSERGGGEVGAGVSFAGSQQILPSIPQMIPDLSNCPRPGPHPWTDPASKPGLSPKTKAAGADVRGVTPELPADAATLARAPSTQKAGVRRRRGRTEHEPDEAVVRVLSCAFVGNTVLGGWPLLW